MIYRCILPAWAKEQHPSYKTVEEGEFDEQKIEQLMLKNYNIYYLPNYPSMYDSSSMVDGSQIDVFEYVYVDMDLKAKGYPSKEAFIEVLKQFKLKPTKIVDSGNGIHAYWRVNDLQVMSFLKLQRRLARFFNTDEAVSKIYQLMRVPNTINTKDPENFKWCNLLEENTNEYSSEQLDNLLPQLNYEDTEYCKNHYETTHTGKDVQKIETSLPPKFGALLRANSEVRSIWTGEVDDRSESDYRLGHILFASGFTRSDACSVLVNCAKALERAPKHRAAYATNIVDKIWTYELEGSVEHLSTSVRDILRKSSKLTGGERFPCYKYFDDTAKGFRLGQVIGLVAGSGVGKTAVALNMFMGFVESNPNFVHFFVALEQPAREIAERWFTMCGERDELFDKVHVIDNYDEAGNFRNLSLQEIEDYVLKFQKESELKVGCVVIDHIGALAKKGKDGEYQDLMTICHAMKPFTVKTNTLLIMQSQTSREKAGIGDLELDKDAAFGTMYFESYCDYLITMWQPLKRCYGNPKCPPVTAYKFCKIRHKKKGEDNIQEDQRYLLSFDPKTERLRYMTQDEETSFDYFNKEATSKRGQDKKTTVLTYQSATTLQKKEAQKNVQP